MNNHIEVIGDIVRVTTYPSGFLGLFNSRPTYTDYGFIPEKYYSITDSNERDIVWVNLDTGIQIKRGTSFYIKLCLQFELVEKSTLLGQEHRKANEKKRSDTP